MMVVVDKRLSLGRRLCTQYRVIEAYQGVEALERLVEGLSDDECSSMLMWMDAELEELHRERTEMSHMIRARRRGKV